MKHKLVITPIILCMFLLTQFIGIYVIASGDVPSYFKQDINETEKNYGNYFFQIFSSLVFAIIILSLITKYKLNLVLKTWFFIVVAIALSISFYVIIKNVFGFESYALAFFIALVFSVLKTYRPSLINHNFTEIFIYPGIAVLFVPLLNWIYALLLLIFLSIYDIWAVWRSSFMIKMAKYQMKELRVLGGFLIPYANKKINRHGNKKMKVRLAILGGGDVVFPIIVAGVFLLSFGLSSAIAVILGAFAGLCYLLFFGEKKMYPAIPYITIGIFLALLVWRTFISF